MTIFFPFLYLLQGTCVADPDKCDGGLTVSVWIKYNQNEAKDFQKKHNYKYSYILSTGGQRQDSRCVYALHSVLNIKIHQKDWTKSVPANVYA